MMSPREFALLQSQLSSGPLPSEEAHSPPDVGSSEHVDAQPEVADDVYSPGTEDIVTLDASELADIGNVFGSDPRRSFRKKVEKAVGRCCGQYFKMGRIGSKEDFKRLSRKIAHRVMQKEHGNIKFDKHTPTKIRKYVDAWFAKHYSFSGHRE